MINRVMIHRRFYPLFAVIFMGLYSLPAFAQAPGWSEQKILQSQTAIEDRVSLPAIAADGDNIYIAYRQGPIKLLISRDRGKTWQSPLTIDTTYLVNSAPAITVVGSRLLLVWPAQRETGEQVAYQLMFVQSNDNGQTWSEPDVLSNTQEHTFSPRFYVEGNRAYLLWLETPPLQISTGQRPQLTPESIDTYTSGDSLNQGTRTQMRSVFYVSTFEPTTGFSDPVRVGEASGQRLPHIFNIIGRIEGNILVAANQNQEIKLYRSDSGQEWQTHLQGREMFDTRKLEDVKIIDGNRVSTWIRRTAYEQVPVYFETENDERPVQLAAPHYVRSIPRFTFDDGVYHVVWEAGNQEESWLTYIRTDEIPPTSSIVMPTEPALTSFSNTFAWQANDNISSTDRLVYSYKYGDEPWSSLQQEAQTIIPAPPDGEYVFQVRAEDVAGNIQEPPAEFAFNTFQVAPKTTITEAPETGEVLDVRQVTVTFEQQDNTDSPSEIQYSAQVDDGSWTEFADGNEHTFKNLSNGEHTLSIRSRDTNNNIEESPAAIEVTVNVGLSVAFIGDPVVYTDGSSVEFSWQATDDKGNPVQLAFYYRLDDDQARMTEETSVELTDLNEGSHELTLWGVAPSGDTTSEVTHDFIVDQTPPDTSASFNKEFFNDLPVIQLTSTDPELPDGTQPISPTKYEYQFDSDEWTEFVNTGNTWTLSKPLPFYAWGYIVKVRAIDAAGNVDPSPASVNLLIYNRSNPYIFWPVVGVLALIILYILFIILKKIGSRRPKRSKVSSTSTTSSTLSFDEDETSSSSSDFGSSFDLDEDEDKKNDDPYA